MSLCDYHDFEGGTSWRVTPDGVQLEGKSMVERTTGPPRSMQLYLALWGQYIRSATEQTGVPMALLMMTLGCENGTAYVLKQRLQYVPSRIEPGYISDAETPHRVSIGPMHVLISTARMALNDPELSRERIERVPVNILAAAKYIRQQRKQTNYDPILVAASYNAGGLYSAHPGAKLGNRWHLRSWGDHLGRAARWYGDACMVLRQTGEFATLDTDGKGRVVT